VGRTLLGSVANSFQQDADLKLSSLQEAKKEACGKILANANAVRRVVCGYSIVFLKFMAPLLCWDNVVTDPEAEECKKL
jgi:hypothetical protein